MGKNTMMRKCIREYCERKGDNTWMVMHDKLVGNVGIVFTTGELSEVRAKIAEYVVPAPARVNSIAPLDVVVPAGPTGMEPSQTGFFQVLNIATKINKGAIEILSDVTVVQKDEKVSSSAATLLAKMGFTPFFYGLETLMVYDKGNMYDVKVLDIDDAKLGEMFAGGSQEHRGALLRRQLPHHRHGSPRHHQRLQEPPLHRLRVGLHLRAGGEVQGAPLSDSGWYFDAVTDKI